MRHPESFYWCLRCADLLLLPGLDYPYITTLLPNSTIEIHSVETQAIVQVIGAPPASSSPPTSPNGQIAAQGQRLGLTSSVGGYLVPSSQKSDKMRMVSVGLMRGPEMVA